MTIPNKNGQPAPVPAPAIAPTASMALSESCRFSIPEMVDLDAFKAYLSQHHVRCKFGPETRLLHGRRVGTMTFQSEADMLTAFSEVPYSEARCAIVASTAASTSDTSDTNEDQSQRPTIAFRPRLTIGPGLAHKVSRIYFSYSPPPGADPQPIEARIDELYARLFLAMRSAGKRRGDILGIVPRRAFAAGVSDFHLAPNDADGLVVLANHRDLAKLIFDLMQAPSPAAGVAATMASSSSAVASTGDGASAATPYTLIWQPGEPCFQSQFANVRRARVHSLVDKSPQVVPPKRRRIEPMLIGPASMTTLGDLAMTAAAAPATGGSSITFAPVPPSQSSNTLFGTVRTPVAGTWLEAGANHPSKALPLLYDPPSLRVGGMKGVRGPDPLALLRDSFLPATLAVPAHPSGPMPWSLLAYGLYDTMMQGTVACGHADAIAVVPWHRSALNLGLYGLTGSLSPPSPPNPSLPSSLASPSSLSSPVPPPPPKNARMLAAKEKKKRKRQSRAKTGSRDAGAAAAADDQPTKARSKEDDTAVTAEAESLVAVFTRRQHAPDLLQVLVASGCQLHVLAFPVYPLGHHDHMSLLQHLVALGEPDTRALSSTTLFTPHSGCITSVIAVPWPGLADDDDAVAIVTWQRAVRGATDMDEHNPDEIFLAQARIESLPDLPPKKAGNHVEGDTDDDGDDEDDDAVSGDSGHSLATAASTTKTVALDLFRHDQQDRCVTAVDGAHGYVVVGDDAGGVSVWDVARLTRSLVSGTHGRYPTKPKSVTPDRHLEVVNDSLDAPDPLLSPSYAKRFSDDEPTIVSVSARIHQGEPCVFIMTRRTFLQWHFASSTPIVLHRSTADPILAMAMDNSGTHAVLIIGPNLVYILFSTSRIQWSCAHHLDVSMPIKIEFDARRPSLFSILNAGELSLWDTGKLRLPRPPPSATDHLVGDSRTMDARGIIFRHRVTNLTDACFGASPRVPNLVVTLKNSGPPLQYAQQRFTPGTARTASITLFRPAESVFRVADDEGREGQ
ncbi:hypothetical protein BC828DRAFT_377345 [Blastocladiella britannica]|nr:hypothetical protein BC828DRAFT_377345 [Blastocladiella britannica]